MLTINNLSFAYGKSLVLNKLNLNIGAGQVHGIVGLNGSGKTTLFNLIYGLLKPKTGAIKWNDNKLLRTQISFLETGSYFYSNITGREHLQLFVSDHKFNVDIWQELLKLPLDELIENYSTGMKKKLAILSVLKLNKPILLLDEPFNEIDLETSRIIMILLKKLKEKGRTILVSSHILETLINACDYIHHLENKCIIKSYSKQDFEIIEHNIFGDFENRVSQKIEKGLG